MRTFSDSSPELVSARTSLDSSDLSDFSLISRLDALSLGGTAGLAAPHSHSRSQRRRTADSAADSVSPYDSTDSGSSYEIIVIPGPESRGFASSSTSVVAVASSTSARSRTLSSDSESGSCLTPSEFSSSLRSGGTERPSTLSHPSGARLSSVPHHRSAETPHTRSVLSASEAQLSIDSFLAEPQEFMSEAANKLRLWQALCIELGLVELEGAPLPDLPLGVSTSSQDTSRSATPTQDTALPSLPQSLTQARRLLKERAHVNIVEYLKARADPDRHAKHDGEAAGKYADLVHPSASAMMREARRQHKFLPVGKAKTEWLEPLLKDFGNRRARAAA